MDNANGTRPARWVVAITLALGAAAAVAVTADTQPADRTFAALADPVQSLMSVAVPLLGIVLVRDLRRSFRSSRSVPVGPRLVAGALVAAAIGAYGGVVCAAALAVAPDGVAADAWRHAGTIALGGVLVQVVAYLVGTGLGLLLRRSAVVAFLATIVLPLGLWWGLGAVDLLRPAQAWLVPYPSVRNLLSGDMSPVRWAQWLVVLLIWGVGLNAVGLARLRRAVG